MATFTATATGSSKSLRHETLIGDRHAIATDEPESVGGTDSAPMPHELLPAALASCISTMIAIYAQRRGWSLGEVRVDVDYDYESTPRRFDVMVHLPDGLTNDQIVRLRRVAETCPVRRAFESGIVVTEQVEARPLAA